MIKYTKGVFRFTNKELKEGIIADGGNWYYDTNCGMMIHQSLVDARDTPVNTTEKGDYVRRYCKVDSATPTIPIENIPALNRLHFNTATHKLNPLISGIAIKGLSNKPHPRIYHIALPYYEMLLVLVNNKHVPVLLQPVDCNDATLLRVLINNECRMLIMSLKLGRDLNYELLEATVLNVLEPAIEETK